MAILLVFFLLFGFSAFGSDSYSTGTGHAVPHRSVQAQPSPRDPCNDSRWGKRGQNHRKPRPMRMCAPRLAVTP